MQNIVSIQNITIRQTPNNLYSLNDLHKASGGQDKHAPRRWLQNQQTDELIAELSKDGNSSLNKNQQVIQVVKGGNNSGTFVCKELVIHYAMWISAKFSLQVIQTFLNTIENSGNLKTEKTTKDERTGLRQAVTMLVGKADINHSAAYKLVHHRFGVSSIEDLTHEQIPQAIEYVHRLILDGEVLDKTQATPFNQTEFACHFVKLLNYARCYLRFQKLLCNDPNSPKAQELLNFFQYSVNVNQTGFLFVFKPDVENDIQKAADFIHHHFQQHDLQMI